MNAATYSPEDNKLRLYVGRVPRDEYEALRAEGWTSTPKQDCDFVATWTPARRDRCLAYADVIEDEDQGPAERAADRAERFSGYRDKREGEAIGHADTYDAGPSAYGFQNKARAVRAADRHDRTGTRAVDAWGKAEYWTSRTAGVIAHALYVSTPAVRMGRIKTLEAELRQYGDGVGERATHLRFRLAYENQMLDAQGGRAAFVEMQVGGWIGSHQIRRINKSAATGRVVSVQVLAPSRWKTGTQTLQNIATERLPADAYRAPSAEDLAALATTKAAEKASAPKKAPCPLINPTDADAERLQAAWNEAAKAKHEARCRESTGWKLDDFTPSTVCRITQATYSANSGGNYARAQTRGIQQGGKIAPTHAQLYHHRLNGLDRIQPPTLCQIRTADGATYMADRVIVLTDKPQKPLPAGVFPEVGTIRTDLFQSQEAEEVTA